MFGEFDLDLPVTVTYTFNCSLCDAQDGFSSVIFPMQSIIKPHPPPGWCCFGRTLFCDKHTLTVFSDGEPLKWTPDGKPYIGDAPA